MSNDHHLHPHHRSSWDPPPTDGPQTRFRLSQGVAPVSGSILPTPHPPTPPCYPFQTPSSAAVMPRDCEQEWILSDDWTEWEKLQASLAPITGPSSTDFVDEYQWNHQFVYDPSLPSPAGASYYMEPSLAFSPSYTEAESQISYSHSSFECSSERQHHSYPSPAKYPTPAQPPLNNARTFPPSDRIVSSASIVDHGEEPAADERSTFELQLPTPFVDSLSASSFLPARSTTGESEHRMSKDEWLRLGGFLDDDIVVPPLPFGSRPRASPSVLSHPQSSPTKPSQDPALSKRSAPSPSPKKRARTAPYEKPATSSFRSSIPASASSLRPTPPPNPAAETSTFSLSALPALPSHLLQPPPSSLPAVNPARKSHARKRSATHIPRPRNAFILFRSHAVTSGLLPQELGIVDHKNISKVIGALWKGLGEGERIVWERMAEEEKRLHREKYPAYKYQPKQAPPKRGSRQVAIKEEDEDSDLEVVGRDSDDDFEDEKKEKKPSPIKRKGVDAPYRSQVRVKPTGRVTRSSSPTKPALDEAPTPRDPFPSPMPSVLRTPLESFTESSPFPSPTRAKVEWTQDRVDATAQALLEGEEGDELKRRIEEQLSSSIGPSDPFSSSAPLARPETSTTSTPTKPFKHSRLARRGSSSTHGTLTPASSPVRDSPLSSSQGASGARHHPYASPGPLHGRMAKEQSYAMAQLSVSRPPPPPQPNFGPTTSASFDDKCTTNDAYFPPTPASTTFQFDNSPLLAPLSPPVSDSGHGQGQGRRFSLGRWELRKPSSRREVLALQEEERIKNSFDAGSFGGSSFLEGFEEGFEEALEDRPGAQWHVGREALFDTTANAGLGISWGSQDGQQRSE